MIWLLAIGWLISGFIGACYCYGFFQAKSPERWLGNSVVSLVVALSGPIGLLTQLTWWSPVDLEWGCSKGMKVPFTR